jgi:uncharacterized protein YegL
MTGDPIESVKVGIRTLHQELMDDPSAVESAYLSVISFGSDAQQLVPLTELVGFTPPDLTASGTTALGAALKLLLERMAGEVRQNSGEVKGDWKPLVFVLTDGSPTDDWLPYATQLKSKKPGNVIAVACGDGADTALLKSLTDTVLEMKSTSPSDFKVFFKWVTQSIKTTSAKCGEAPGEAASGISLPPPPVGITIIP